MLCLGFSGTARAADAPDAFWTRAVAEAGVPGGRCEPTFEADASGRVVRSRVVDAIEGYARGATGGVGHRVLSVEFDEDVKSSASRPPPPGTVRWAIETAAREGGGWIVFKPAAGGRVVRLATTLRVPSNTTIDGGCGGVVLRSDARQSLLTVRDVENVVVSGLSMTKDDYVDSVDKTGDAISLTGWSDRVAIVHNAFRRCGDGCVDIVRLDRDDREERVTVSDNTFTDHNKTMLIGTLACYNHRELPGCADPTAAVVAETAPKAFVSVLRNVFDRVSQRNPKVVSNALVQFSGNLVRLGATRYPGGRDSAVYGAASASGGILVSEHNVFVDDADSTGHVARGSVSLFSDKETPGFVVARGDSVIGDMRLGTEPVPAGVSLDVPLVRVPERPDVVARCALAGAGPAALSRDLVSACAMDLRR